MCQLVLVLLHSTQPLPLNSSHTKTSSAKICSHSVWSKKYDSCQKEPLKQWSKQSANDTINFYCSMTVEVGMQLIQLKQLPVNSSLISLHATLTDPFCSTVPDKILQNLLHVQDLYWPVITWLPEYICFYGVVFIHLFKHQCRLCVFYFDFK